MSEEDVNALFKSLHSAVSDIVKVLGQFQKTLEKRAIRRAPSPELLPSSDEEVEEVVVEASGDGVQNATPLQLQLDLDQHELEVEEIETLIPVPTPQAVTEAEQEILNAFQAWAADDVLEAMPSPDPVASYNIATKETTSILSKLGPGVTLTFSEPPSENDSDDESVEPIVASGPLPQKRMPPPGLPTQPNRPKNVSRRKATSAKRKSDVFDDDEPACLCSTLGRGLGLEQQMTLDQTLEATMVLMAWNHVLIMNRMMVYSAETGSHTLVCPAEFVKGMMESFAFVVSDMFPLVPKRKVAASVQSLMLLQKINIDYHEDENGIVFTAVHKIRFNPFYAYDVVPGYDDFVKAMFSKYYEGGRRDGTPHRIAKPQLAVPKRFLYAQFKSVNATVLDGYWDEAKGSPQSYSQLVGYMQLYGQEKIALGWKMSSAMLQGAGVKFEEYAEKAAQDMFNQ